MQRIRLSQFLREWKRCEEKNLSKNLRRNERTNERSTILGKE